MIINFFSFRGRIPRLQFFLSAMGLGAAVVMISVCLGLSVFAGGAKGATSSVLVLAGAALVLGPIYLWISLALHAKRLRDIGWDPVLVIPIWIVVQILDVLAAHSAPSLRVGALHSQTLFGVALNLFLGGCLLFWPSRGEDPDAGDGQDLSRPVTPPPAANLQRPRAPQAAAGFGRRGL